VRSDVLDCVGECGVQDQRKKRAVAGQRTRRDGREEILGDNPKMRVSIDGDAATTGDVEVAGLTR
jgi:hypothetical protein